MPKKEVSKTEARELIKTFFSNIKQKTPVELKKIKRLAMKNRISLKEYKPLFCRKCLTPYSIPKIRIKNKMKIIECNSCGEKRRFGFSNSS